MADAIVATAEAVMADDVAATASGTKNTAEGSGARFKAMTSGGDRRLLFVHFKERELRAGNWVATLHDGTALAGESLKRVACDLRILAVRSDEAGRPSELGRKRRPSPPH